MNKAAWDATPTDYQTRLLLAALADTQHRIPSDAKRRTLKIMADRQWVRPRRLALIEGGIADWRLTHHGVNAANRAHTAQLPAGHPVGSAAVEPQTARRIDRWTVKDREGTLITEVEATSYHHAVQVADQDPQVRAATPGAGGGLIFTRLASIEKPAPTAAAAAPAPFCPPTLPWYSRVRRASDGRFGTVTGYDPERRTIIKWDGAVVPDPHHYTNDELATPAFQVSPAVTHCSGCGHIVDDDEIEDSYTTCCNEGACSGCAAVNGVYTCGTKAPADSPA
ncbi:hypothetical protein [Streptomyces sp. NPDC059003]|uniref:hypothetical protein n=1 Tax=Streptomyces sp. NPDC059003 TaxID=3346691 RepID=UPI0036A4EBB3